MKKIYNAPVARVHNLHATKMIADSFKVNAETEVSASESLTNEENDNSLWVDQW